jgi:hypothetical protein
MWDIVLNAPIDGIRPIRVQSAEGAIANTKVMNYAAIAQGESPNSANCCILLGAETEHWRW